MKNVIKNSAGLLLLSMIFVGFISLQGCGGGSSDPSPSGGGGSSNSKADAVKTQLAVATWKAVAVTVNGTTDQTALFKNFTIKFTGNTYVTTNGGLVWPATDTFTFTSDDATAFKRGDNIPVTIDVLNDAGLILSFTWLSTTYAGGKQNSITGKYTFIFNK